MQLYKMSLLKSKNINAQLRFTTESTSQHCSQMFTIPEEKKKKRRKKFILSNNRGP
jgi:hypothetical protein